MQDTGYRMQGAGRSRLCRASSDPLLRRGARRAGWVSLLLSVVLLSCGLVVPSLALDLKITHEEGISDLDITSVTVKGTRRYQEGEVYVFWGQTDGGTNNDTWAYTNHFPYNTDDPYVYSTNLTSLYSGTKYYYMFYATNVANGWEAWATNAGDVRTFTTLKADLNIDNVSVTEGDSGTTNATFTVTLTYPSGTNVSVNYDTVDDTALSGQDFTTTSGTLNYSPGETSKTITVTVSGDYSIESHETFFVDLSSAVNADIGGTGRGTCTIWNDDTAPTINNSGGATGITDTAAWLNGNLTSTGSESSYVYVFWGPVNGNSNKTSWAHTNQFPGIRSTGLHTTNITSGLDPDTTYYYRYYATNAAGDAWASSSAEFTTFGPVGIRNLGASNITISSARMYGELTNGVSADTYVYWGPTDCGTNDGVPKWANTNSLGTKTETSFYSTATPLLASTPYYYRYYATNSFDYDWADSSQVFTTLYASLTIQDVVVTEGDTGTTNAAFNVTLSAACGVDVTVRYTTDDNTAVQPDDYTSADAVLTIPAGVTATSIVISVNGDRVGETNETFYLNLSDLTNATFAGGDTQAVCTITDDEPTLTIADTSTDEPDTTTNLLAFTITISESTDADTTVYFETSNGTAQAGTDYVTTSGVATITAGQTTGTFNVGIIGDWIAEFPAAEAFYVNISSPTNARIIDDQSECIIWDNDRPPRINNDGGATNILNTSATMYGNLISTGSAATAVRVYWGLTNEGTSFTDWGNTQYFSGYPSEGLLSTNITGLTPNTVYYYRFYATNFIGDSWSEDGVDQFKTMGVPGITNIGATAATANSANINGDLTNGAQAYIKVYWGLTNGQDNSAPPYWANTNGLGTLAEGAFATNVTGLLSGTTYWYTCYATNAYGTAWAQPSHSFTTLLSTVSIGGVSITEGDTGTTSGVITVSLSTLSARTVTAEFSSTDGTADSDDYFSTNGTVTIPAGQLSTTIVLQVKGDWQDESNETFNIVISNAVNVASIADDTGVCTILDDDTRPSIENHAVGATGVLSATAWMNGDLLSTGTVATTVRVYWGETDRTNDAAAWEHTNTFSGYPAEGLVTTNMGGLSGNTWYYYRFYATNSAGEDWSTNVTSFKTFGGPQVTNVGASNITVSAAQIYGQLTDGVSADIWMYWGLVDRTNDAAAWANTNFVGSNVVEGLYSSAASPLLAGTPYYYRSYATNDYNYGWSSTALVFTSAFTTVSIADTSVTEGHSGTTNAAFTVTLAATCGVDVTVAYTTADLTAAAGSDYTAASGVCTIDAGTVSTTITVSVTGERVGESNETFRVNLSSPTNVLLGDATGICTINDDEPRLTIVDAGGAEPNPGVTNDVEVTVSIPSASAADVTVTFATADGTATNGLDYVQTNGTATIAAGQISTTITVRVIGDSEVESTEHLYVDLSSPINCFLSRDQASLSIYDTNAPPEVTLSAAVGITANSARFDGNVTAGWPWPYVSIVWGTADAGTNAGSVKWQHTNTFASTFAGAFSTNITEFSTNQAYYYRVTASNSIGTAWSAESLRFTTYGTIPYSNNFESYANNTDLQFTNGWETADTNHAVVQTSEFYEGSKAARIKRNTRGVEAELSHSFVGPVNTNRIFVDCYIKPVAAPREKLIPEDATAAFYINADRYLVAYNGSTQVVLTTKPTISTSVWTRLLVRLDYENRMWDLWAKKETVEETDTMVWRYNFYSTNQAVFSKLAVREGADDTPNYLDAIAITYTPPTYIQKPPIVDNANGATGIGTVEATLNGTINNALEADAYIYWGDNDGGTNFDAWDYTNYVGVYWAGFSLPVSNLIQNKTYYYRCYGTNDYGWDWADSTTNFVTDKAGLTGLFFEME